MWFKKKEKQILKYWKETIDLFNWFKDLISARYKEDMSLLSSFKASYVSYVKEELKVLELYRQGLMV